MIRLFCPYCKHPIQSGELKQAGNNFKCIKCGTTGFISEAITIIGATIIKPKRLSYGMDRISYQYQA